MCKYDILAIAQFLGDSMTDVQASQLMDNVRMLSISDREDLMDWLDGGPLYTEISMNNAEMGGYSRY